MGLKSIKIGLIKNLLREKPGSKNCLISINKHLSKTRKNVSPNNLLLPLLKLNLWL